jgi:gliding motility associated protien GldN
MKYKILKFSVLAAAMIIMVSAEAQRGRGRTTRGSNQPADTTKPNQQSVQQNTNPSATQQYNPYGNIPIRMAPSVGGFNDTVRVSLRRDAATEKSMFKDRIPLDYEFLRADDALYTQRVWREIDIREKINLPFRYQAQDDNGDQRFVSILVNAVRKELKNGNAIAFSPEDDRFTTFLDSASFEKAIGGGAQCDTLPVYNINDPTKIDSFVVSCGKLNPDDIVKFRIKEEWIFDREASRMFVRILGIAPCKTQFGADGKTEKGVTPLFWIYYPDLRATLARYEVYNPKNMGMSRMTWEELLEARMFSSYLIKSTLDNPMNKYLRTMINDPILRLLEGDNIKDKIFNYEQNLWQY